MNTMDKPTTGPFTGVKPYHWAVVIIASLGWMFDCMDQRIFILARGWALQTVMEEHLLEELPALAEQNPEIEFAPESITSLQDVDALPLETRIVVEGMIQNVVNEYGGYATTAMIVGWATGGILFGILGDRYGRVKTMLMTLFVYTIFTGLSGFSQSWVDFITYRFLFGLGVGGMFGSATTLIAESVPSNFRAVALGLLQALSAFGNILGSLISLGIPPGETNFLWGLEGWRVLFFVGVIPIVLAFPIAFWLRESEAWKQANERARSGDEDHKVGSPFDLFRHPRWRYHTIIGVLFGLSGMAGLWGIGFFSPELIRNALSGLPADEISRMQSIGTALQDVGAFLGLLTVTFIATYFSRRIAFLFSFTAAMIVTIYVFQNLRTPTDAMWMLPIMGFAQLAVFGCYSIYFPELFPTRLRSTGVGFCYNTVRYLAAPFPSLMAYLGSSLTVLGYEEGFRWAATYMSMIFMVGIIAIIWAPETRGQELPED